MKSSIETVLLALYDEFKITYSVAQWFVGLQIEQNVSKKQLRIHQTIYTKKILKRFNYEYSNSVAIPVNPGTKFSRTNDSMRDAQLLS